MNKVAQYYRELVASLSERLRNGERDIDALGGTGARARNKNRGVNANRGR
ncbi:putative alpha helical protein [Escherichia coli]|uniref:Putative alpha helical protein n=1 Tax=Escherichia coli TaxID=562 RepID=A0A376KYT5_ECOLX|nr:putative alpha helical protein [Escherichia coli]